MRPDEQPPTTAPHPTPVPPPTPEDRAALAAIDATFAQPLAATHDHDDPTSLAGLATRLRRSAPQADTAYRLHLRARVLTEARQHLPPPGLITRRRLLAAALAATTIGSATLAAPRTRAALARSLGLNPPPPTIGPIVIERATPLPFNMLAGPHVWAGPDDAQREYHLLTISRERWTLYGHVADQPPVPGTLLPLPGEHLLPIPGYLPAGFQWQGLSVTNEAPLPLRIPSAGGTSGGGGGSGMPWEPPLRYDRRIAATLLGGDPADRLLLLQQLRPDTQNGITISTFQLDLPAQVPPPSPPGTPPPPGPYDARTVLGLLVEPARDHVGLAVHVGPNALHSTTVGGAAAWWFGGQWDAVGRWTDDGTWLSLVWPRDGYIYRLSGQTLTLPELLRVAESLPPLP